MIYQVAIHVEITGGLASLIHEQSVGNDPPHITSVQPPQDGDTGALSYRWEIASGAATLESAGDGEAVKIRGTADGQVVVRLTVDDVDCDNPASSEAILTFSAQARNWIRCDVYGNGERDIADVIFLFEWMFKEGGEPGCLAACDCNSDGELNISDLIFDLRFQFLGGQHPEAPYPACDTFPGCPDSCK